MKIEILDLCEENVDDALLVCTSPKLRDDENVKTGLEIRKNWLLALYRMLVFGKKTLYDKFYVNCAFHCLRSNAKRSL